MLIVPDKSVSRSPGWKRDGCVLFLLLCVCMCACVHCHCHTDWNLHTFCVQKGKNTIFLFNLQITLFVLLFFLQMSVVTVPAVYSLYDMAVCVYVRDLVLYASRLWAAGRDHRDGDNMRPSLCRSGLYWSGDSGSLTCGPNSADNRCSGNELRWRRGLCHLVWVQQIRITLNPVCDAKRALMFFLATTVFKCFNSALLHSSSCLWIKYCV